ncbi:hypothetical protein VB620_10015 [Nodularia harveyana UHCC-0300]|uniref:Uncharacterized protein n=1 Tax=Nodularia harveyana UHCC-0300 TaxID=2974287 RepID=A0ABU5UDT4_9CYAN|nr:hypothetical protein [Nodularia harveyana]MEA5581674.1 hypothetical protein [Nodularia harveyana UHCC-0300]
MSKSKFFGAEAIFGLIDGHLATAQTVVASVRAISSYQFSA